MIKQLVLAYGRETEHRRAIFAVCSFWAWYEGERSNVQTIVFTDLPELFTPHFVGLPVEYRLLTPSILAHMRGVDGYVHRIKLCIINQVIKEQPNDTLFFCDSDTFFIAPVTPLLDYLRSGYSIMHKREHSFEKAITVWGCYSPPQDEYPRRFVDFIKKNVFELHPGTFYNFYASQIMWNSGVVGLPNEIIGLIPAILILNDKFYAASHWIVSEQAALSLVLQTQTEILPSNRYVFHYWGERQKVVMDALLTNLETYLPNTEPLPKRLGRVRVLTSIWKQVVHKDEAHQFAKLALAKGEFLNSIKFTLKVLILNLKLFRK